MWEGRRSVVIEGVEHGRKREEESVVVGEGRKHEMEAQGGQCFSEGLGRVHTWE